MTSCCPLTLSPQLGNTFKSVPPHTPYPLTDTHTPHSRRDTQTYLYPQLQIDTDRHTLSVTHTYAHRYTPQSYGLIHTHSISRCSLLPGFSCPSQPSFLKKGCTLAAPISPLPFIPPPSAICSLFHHVTKLLSFRAPLTS